MPSSSLPFHIIWTPVHSATLDIQHFVSPLTITCGEMCSWHFVWFLICGFVQVLFLSLLIHFYCFNSHFPVTALGQISSKVHILKCFCGTWWLRMAQTNGPAGSLPENGTGAGFWNAVLLEKIRWWTKSKKRRLSVSFTRALFSFLDFSILVLKQWWGVSTPCCIISQKSADLTREFGLALCGPVQSYLVWHFIYEFKTTSQNLSANFNLKNPCLAFK